MSIFALDSNQVMRLASAVSVDTKTEVDESAAAEIFARAAWTGIAEPGDSVAGALVTSLGPVAALTSLVDSWSIERVTAEAVAGGADSIAAHDLALAFDRWRPRLVSSAAITALRQAARVSARLVRPTDSIWPAGVDDLGVHGPIALWVRGIDAALESLSSSVALVGARAATGYGEHMAMELGAGLSDKGVSVVSGAAYGIDGMVHRAVLASGGLTVAFLAGGVDRFYPSGHDALLGRIATVGAVVSELPCGSPPTKWRFLQRNRLIAASSVATVVVEAGRRSGSLNTAAHAASVGRPLGAVPGPVTSPSSAGCHRLIREFDAACVTSVDEVLELASGMAGSAPQPELDLGVDASSERLPPDQLRVLDALSVRSARTTADVARRAGMSMGTTEGALGLLALEGAAIETEAGWRKQKR
ncbi:DNA protecting protein DprA [Agreia bicolorata]|uniref:DNA protecting protein DprA n=1 Tax=Agreia bicolorata TaxID=110935 RepID=A0A1T4YIB1_9MICO|nr:DNA-processing protein DprA [Agreia bicolorata]SKB00975.1 DNA protecting protein DprA [Agreia bicolorata]